MARENQALHIGLIVSVTLTVFLGVATYLFFREYQKATARAMTAEKKLAEAEQTARTVQDEANSLKQHIGWSASDKLPDITETFNKDMDTYGARFGEDERSYRKLVENLYKALQNADVQLQDAAKKIQSYQQQIAQIQAAADSQVAEYKQAMEKLKQDLEQERAAFNKQRAEFTQKTDQLQNTLAQAQQRFEAEIAKKDGTIAQLNQKISELRRAVDTKSAIIDDMVSPRLDVPDGKIRWVNQRERTVWINVGQADNLPNLTTFAVYDAEINDLTTAKKKADIQVVRIIGEHLAEARILEDDLSDPMMPGDILHTPIWSPGQQEHFALTDGLDIDGDGKSDAHVVRNLITMSGGVIDAELDDAGNLHGQLTGQTRYLIIGTQHTAGTPKQLLDARVALLRKAQELGIRTIALGDFLQKAGWREDTNVVTYGRGANPRDFRARFPGGIQPRSTGNVFQPRTLPGASRRTAF